MTIIIIIITIIIVPMVTILPILLIFAMIGVGVRDGERGGCCFSPSKAEGGVRSTLRRGAEICEELLPKKVSLLLNVAARFQELQRGSSLPEDDEEDKKEAGEGQDRPGRFDVNQNGELGHDELNTSYVSPTELLNRCMPGRPSSSSSSSWPPLGLAPKHTLAMSTSMLNMSTDSEDSQVYSDDFDDGEPQPASPAPASSSGGGVVRRRGFGEGRRQAQAVQEDEDNYSDNFEDDTSKATPLSHHSSEGFSAGSDRRRRGSSAPRALGRKASGGDSHRKNVHRDEEVLFPVPLVSGHLKAKKTYLRTLNLGVWKREDLCTLSLGQRGGAFQHGLLHEVLVIFAGSPATPSRKLFAKTGRRQVQGKISDQSTDAEGKDEKRDLFINKLTGKDKYQFGRSLWARGDSKRDLSRFVGGKLQEAVGNFTGKESYEFGDITRSLDAKAKAEVCKVTGKECPLAFAKPVLRAAAQSHGKDVYELGDLSKYLDTQAKKQVAKLTGKDSYEFGDISREIARRVQESDVVDEEVELGNRAASKLTGALAQELDRRAKGVLLGKGNEDYVLGDLTKAQIQRSVASLTGKDKYEFGDISRALLRLGSEPSRPTTPAPPPAPVAAREPAVPPLPPLAQEKGEPPRQPSVPGSRATSERSLGRVTPPLPPPAQDAGPDPTGPLRPPAPPEPDQEAVPASPGPFEGSRQGFSLPLKPVPVLPTPAEVWRAPSTLGKEGPASCQASGFFRL
ncbi:hypothetical protein AK812_SmicGene12698 [Symbiodinium microadriaticum]|uniref:Uncharacterized protein n=1 Tax=Symbiodinium microadriaticum TaxID=2951 RepID=A0A1Q9E9Z3_SYMMI|nr:hypothetical protein AK812_SmicGene12698 [Symbiodinium microadriaticum]